MKNKILCFLFLLVLGVPLKSSALRLGPDAEISVLTCGPSELIHAIYGHTAIRVKDQRRMVDIVFNYGVFSFNAPNFVYRFAKGQTDYLLAPERFNDFFEDYKRNGRSIQEQVLNLTVEEKQNLLDFLIENAKPENREYRYNFFFDNCATRVRDVVEEQVDGKVVFPLDNGQNMTFRKHVTHYQKILPWTNFGIQLTLGSPADQVASAYEEMFLPEYLFKHFADATIETEAGKRPLIKETKSLFVSGKEMKGGFFLLSPVSILLICLLFVTSYISYREFKKSKISYGIDYILLLLTGLIGIAALWFVTYSEHPAMHPNYNMCWAVPFNLPFAVLWTVKKWRPFLSWYWIGLSVWMILFFVFNFVLPQSFHLGFYLIALMILCRSLLHSFQQKKHKRGLVI